MIDCCRTKCSVATALVGENIFKARFHIISA